MSDIAKSGGDADAAASSNPTPATELMVAFAYDMVSRRNPVAFLGMVFVLEGTSINLATQAADAIREVRPAYPRTPSAICSATAVWM